jgi:pyruvate,water dikinase
MVPTQSRRYFVGHQDPPVDGALVGGKAARLLALHAAGVSVPPWFCLTTEFHREVLGSRAQEIAARLRGLTVADPVAVRKTSDELQTLVRTLAVPSELQRALLERFDRELGDSRYVAVRSSVVGEDSQRDSFAGQMDSYLFVRRHHLVERVLDCFASAYTSRALLYRIRRHGRVTVVAAAVVVQQMVDCRAAGVLFTANPRTGDRSEAVISAAFGLGEGVVAGTVEADTYYAELETGKPRRADITTKSRKVVFDAATGGGTCTVEVPSEDAARPVLDEEQIAALCRVGARIRALSGDAPQDIEWGFDEAGRLHVLQARPITTLPTARVSVFDNSNIVESYPGLILPLTFSHARRGYEIIFSQNVLEVTGSRTVYQDNRQIYANLVALVDGRLYYNLLNWYEMFRVVPGFEWLLPAWEKALGLEGLTPPSRAAPRHRLRMKMYQARATWRILRILRRLPRHIRRYGDEIRRARSEVDRDRLAERSTHDLVDMTEVLAERLMRGFWISPFNDAWGQQLHHGLGNLIERWHLGDPVELRNSLLCGATDMESVAPVRSLLRMVDLIRADATLADTFSSSAGSREIWERIQQRPEFGALRHLVDDHVARFGDRVVQELKLETETLADRPETIVVMLRNFLAGRQTNAGMEAHERALRERAEAQVLAALRGHPLRRRLFAAVLRRLRAAVRDRENLRFERTRAVGILRAIYRELGRRLHANGLLGDERDIHYLTIDEVTAYVYGAAVTIDARSLVELRRREYRQFADRHPPPRITMSGSAHTAASAAAPVTTGPTGGETLKGTGCGGGVVESDVKVVIDPGNDVEVRGEVLVAPSTDPGWVFLMVAAAALVSERGSLLSHTAIVGRELGIPTVVGVKDATRVLRSGQRVRVDGSAGTVEMVSSPTDPSR